MTASSDSSSFAFASFNFTFSVFPRHDFLHAALFILQNRSKSPQSRSFVIATQLQQPLYKFSTPHSGSRVSCRARSIIANGPMSRPLKFQCPKPPLCKFARCTSPIFNSPSSAISRFTQSPLCLNTRNAARAVLLFARAFSTASFLELASDSFHQCYTKPIQRNPSHREA